MPKIDVLTATGQQGVAFGTPGTLHLPSARPHHLGAHGFEQVSQFGQTLDQIDQTLQAQRERLEVVTMAAEFEKRIEPVKVKALTFRDPQDQQEFFDKEVDRITSDFDPLISSSAVRTTIASYITERAGRHAVELQAESRKRAVESLLFDYEKLDQALADQQATLPLGSAEDLTARAERRELWFGGNGPFERGLLSDADTKKRWEQSNDRYWQRLATTQPERLLQLAAEDTPHIDLDRARLPHYINLALQQKHRIEAQQAREIKAVQEGHEAELTARLMEGESVRQLLPALQRSRDLTPVQARTLLHLEEHLASAPDTSKLVPGLEARWEGRLRGWKYDPGAMPPDTKDTLIRHFTDGAITKEEFGHLMSLWTTVKDQANQTGKEDYNRKVTRAVDYVTRSLTTTGGLMDKFDALSEQNLASARLFLYQALEDDPNADPWAVAQQTLKIFKPVVESRLNIESTDQRKLDQATMQAAVAIGKISHATYRAWEQGQQTLDGQRIVDETLKALPPPPKPSFLDTIKKRFERRGQ